MGLLVGSPSRLQTPPPLPFSSSSSSSSLFPSQRKPANKRLGYAVYCASGESDVGAATGASRRRALLLVGISVLPFLKLGAMAAEGLMVDGFQTVVPSISDEIRQKIYKVQAISFRRRAKTTKQVFTEVDKDKQDIGKPNEQDVIMPDKQDLAMPDKQVVIMPDKHDVIQPETQFLKDTVLEDSSQGPNQFEQAHLQNAPSNSFISFLNELGVIASGVLGALYATSQKEKTVTESTVESMKHKLTSKEAAMSSMKENFEKLLQWEQEEKRKQVKKFKEDETSLLNQLASANGTTATLHQELKNERKLVEELKGQMGQLESSFSQTAADKKLLDAKFREKVDSFNVLQDRISLLNLEINDNEEDIESLKSSLSENESEYKKLGSNVEHVKKELAIANSTIKQLKEEIVGAKADLSSKVSSIDTLNEKIRLLNSEKDKSLQRVKDLMKDYNDLKSSSERKAALDAELLSKKDDQLHHLEEKLELALAEARKKNAVVTELRKEKDGVKSLLEKGVNMKKLKDDLQATREALEASKLEVSIVSKELDEAKGSYDNLMCEVSEMQDGFNEMEKLLTSSVEEAKSSSKLLSDELVSVKEALRRTKDELDITSKELKDVVADRKNLKEELVETYKKLEATVHEVTEERKMVSTLNRELEVLGKQMQRDSEALGALEADLDEATKSLDEMNKNALLLSRELESSNTLTTSLEAEKEMLFKSLSEQKNITKEAWENIKDAQNLILLLGSERESVEKRTRKLEEELAFAKGEILRLRRQISLEKESDDRLPKTTEVAAETPITVRKTSSRRKKGGSTREVS
ncbi:unnamed protein product [Musa hybrid cultivar]